MSYTNYQLPAGYSQPPPAPNSYPMASSSYQQQQQYSPTQTTSSSAAGMYDPFGQQAQVSPSTPQQQASGAGAGAGTGGAFGFAQPPTTPEYQHYQQQHQQNQFSPASSQALVPSYGPPPTTTPSQPQSSPSTSNLDPDLAAIIASQERAMAEARERNLQGPSSSMISSTSSTYSNSNRGNALVPQAPHSAPPSTLVDSTAQRNSRKISDAIHPGKFSMKSERKTKTAAGAASGAVIGGLMFGPAFPVGMVLGGAVGGYATNKLSKSGERRAQREYEQANFQKQALRSHVKDAAYV